MSNVKYFIGPMTKNVVDAILEFSEETGNVIGFIPSRRQVEWDGGYVNNWTTKEFSEYVSGRLPIKRDHSGPGQGYTDDDGFESLKEDCKYLDYIHIDPWKKYPKYDDGLDWTVKMIEFCYELNPNIQYEIGTEQSIREFDADELDDFVNDVNKRLPFQIFKKITHLVIQSGTSLKGNVNTGEYDSERLTEMVDVASKWGLISKEHNGDYIPVELIKEKMSLGLDSINIAPEFGLIETISYIESNIDIDKFWKICYDSKRWVKWVDDSFDPINQKEDLIKICGHYVLSHSDFISIKPNIDDVIKQNVKKKLYELYR
jgi:fructose/tagatose bisphosphate aldolase